VIKVPFTGDVQSFRKIIATSPVPVVAAGGPRCESLHSALEMMAKVVESGARGATIGRNLWGTPDPTLALRAFRAVIHDGMTATAALESVGLSKPRARKVPAEIRSVDGALSAGPGKRVAVR